MLFLKETSLWKAFMTDKCLGCFPKKTFFSSARKRMKLWVEMRRKCQWHRQSRNSNSVIHIKRFQLLQGVESIFLIKNVSQQKRTPTFFKKFRIDNFFSSISQTIFCPSIFDRALKRLLRGGVELPPHCQGATVLLSPAFNARKEESSIDQSEVWHPGTSEMAEESDRLS